MPKSLNRFLKVGSLKIITLGTAYHFLGFTMVEFKGREGLTRSR